MKLKRFFSFDIPHIKFDILLSLALIGAGVKFLFHLERYLDIQLYDESMYLYRGISRNFWGFANSQLGPLYSFWYYILSLFQHDSIDLYFLSYKILTITLPVLLFILLRRYGVPRLPSFLATYFILISTGNFLVMPRISHFAICIILFSIIVYSFISDPGYKAVTIITGALLSSYVRPELFITFIIFLCLFILNNIKYKTSFYRNIKALCILGLNILIAFSAFGIPLTKDTRSFDAFRQHFSLNWVKWNSSTLSPWTNSDEIIKSNFGNAKNIFQAMFANSGIFLQHISQNIRSSISEFAGLYKHPAVLLSDNNKFQRIELLIIIVIILLYALYRMFIQKTDIPGILKDNIRRRKTLVLICSGYIMPLLVSITIIYPRKHYLIILSVMLMIMLILTLFSPTGENKNTGNLQYFTLLAFLAGLIIITPHSSKMLPFPQDTKNISTIRYLRSLKIKDKVNLLEANGGLNVYIGSNYQRVAEYEKNCPFSEFMIQKNINMIVLSSSLSSDSRFQSDSSWFNFIRSYEQYHFLKLSGPQSNIVVFVKNAGIPKGRV